MNGKHLIMRITARGVPLSKYDIKLILNTAVHTGV